MNKITIKFKEKNGDNNKFVFLRKYIFFITYGGN